MSNSGESADGGVGEFIEVAIPDLLDAERLDRVISTLSSISRSKAADIIAAGGVEIDAKVVTQRSYRVKTSEIIRFAQPEEPTAISVEADADIDFGVIYSDEHVIVIDKPAGLVVHPGAGRPDKTLVNGLIAKFPEIENVGQKGRPGIVHRLDQQTSGVLMVARTQVAYDKLVAALARRDVERHYLAVVDGNVTDTKGIVEAPIGRNPNRRTKMAISVEGKPAITNYLVLDRSDAKPGATALRATLETGRTHQIRVHLSAIGHPVLGDGLYAGKLCAQRFGRVALHAHRLVFEHPIDNRHMAFSANVPQDMAQLAHGLGLDFDGGRYGEDIADDIGNQL